MHLHTTYFSWESSRKKWDNASHASTPGCALLSYFKKQMSSLYPAPSFCQSVGYTGLMQAVLFHIYNSSFIQTVSIFFSIKYGLFKKSTI